MEATRRCLLGALIVQVVCFAMYSCGFRPATSVLNAVRYPKPHRIGEIAFCATYKRWRHKNEFDNTTPLVQTIWTLTSDGNGRIRTEDSLQKYYEIFDVEHNRQISIWPSLKIQKAFDICNLSDSKPFWSQFAALARVPEPDIATVAESQIPAVARLASELAIQIGSPVSVSFLISALGNKDYEHPTLFGDENIDGHECRHYKSRMVECWYCPKLNCCVRYKSSESDGGDFNLISYTPVVSPKLFEPTNYREISDQEFNQLPAEFNFCPNKWK